MSNLPPGVSVGMIPGNRPEDESDEAFWDALYDKLGPDATKWLDDADVETSALITKIVNAARDLGHTLGFNEGKAEAQIERALQEQDRAEAELKNMAEAHAEGQHADFPREFCPECKR